MLPSSIYDVQTLFPDVGIWMLVGQEKSSWKKNFSMMIKTCQVDFAPIKREVQCPWIKTWMGGEEGIANPSKSTTRGVMAALWGWGWMNIGPHVLKLGVWRAKLIILVAAVGYWGVRGNHTPSATTVTSYHVNWQILTITCLLVKYNFSNCIWRIC